MRALLRRFDFTTPLRVALAGAVLVLASALPAAAQTATPTPVTVATPIEKAHLLVVTARGSCLVTPALINATTFEPESCSAPGAQVGNMVIMTRTDARTTNDADSLRVYAAYVSAPDTIMFLLGNMTAGAINATVPLSFDFVVIK